MSADRFDVVIIGGGAMGSSVSFFLKHELGFAGSVAVIERDPTFQTASTSLSTSGIRLQFSTPENIRLSAFGVEFLTSLKDRFGPEADAALKEQGYLILGGPEARGIIESNVAIQNGEGAGTLLLEPPGLRAQFPWLNLENVAAASYGPKREGWFDAVGVHATLRRKAKEAGAELLTDEVVAISRAGPTLTGVTLASGRTISAGAIVLAAGPRAGRVAKLAGIDLPVEGRKRTAFVVHCRNGPAAMPLLTDTTGVWIRPEGQYHLCGWSPPEEDDPAADPEDFEPVHSQFEDVIWPALAHRIPVFEETKVIRAYAGHYDHNKLDQNAIIGRHPEVSNLYFINGFSGHGVQQAAGAGRAVAELINFGGYRTIDLSVFGFERVLAGKPVLEVNII
ncbi:MAG: FAD-binding oxidoreductase [Hyphomicrobiaceae bacterium]